MLILHNDQFTCIQNVCFIFSYFEKENWLLQKKGTSNKNITKNKITHESIRNLESLLSHRLLRIAGMVEVLQGTHDVWITTEKSYKIIMETAIVDFNEALAILRKNGFTDDEYILEIEYERKWGIL